MEKEFVPPTQGQKVNTSKDSRMSTSSIDSGVKITPARKPIEISKPKSDQTRTQIPVKKEHLKATQQRSERHEVTAQKDFRWMHFRDIPITYEDYQKKQRKWKSFDQALELIGLESREVEQRLYKGKCHGRTKNNKGKDVSKLPRNT